MAQLKAVGEYDKNADKTIVIGRKESIPEDIPHDKLILHGNCTRKWRDRGIFIPGCPPGEVLLMHAVKDGKVLGPDDTDELRDYNEAIGPVWSSYVLEQSRKYHEEEK